MWGFDVYFIFTTIINQKDFNVHQMYGVMWPLIELWNLIIDWGMRYIFSKRHNTPQEPTWPQIVCIPINIVYEYLPCEYNTLQWSRLLQYRLTSLPNMQYSDDYLL